jgi:hypothetical protein
VEKKKKRLDDQANKENYIRDRKKLGPFRS